MSPECCGCSATASYNVEDSSPFSNQEVRRNSVTLESVPRSRKATAQSESTESLTVITSANKNWWYWVKFAVFMATPFIARQVGIFVGKRMMARTLDRK